MQRTTNLQLYKPEYTDAVDVEVLNQNMDTIDTEVANAKAKQCIVVTGEILTGSSTTIRNSKIDSSMVCPMCYLGDPSAQGSALTIVTADTNGGQVTINGTITADTTITMYLVQSR